MMKKILLVHPSRGRPEQAKKIYEQILNTKAVNDNTLSYILSLDTDDPTLKTYKELFPNITILIHDNSCLVQAVNRAYDRDMLVTFDLVGIATDDTYFAQNWDEELFKILDKHGYDKAIKVTSQFQGNTNLLTFPVGGNQFFLDYGTFHYHEYLSVYADDDMTEWAIKNNRYVEARHLVFPHMQYSLGPPQNIIDQYGQILPHDETYAKQNSAAAYEIGGKVLEKRRRNNFQ